MMQSENTLSNRLEAAVKVLPKLHNAPSKLQAFLDAGGMVSYLDPARGYRARLLGFTATATGSGAGAVANWMRQVEGKAGIF